MQAKLIVLAGLEPGREFLLKPHGTTIGRVAGCDVVLDDATISRHHAVLTAVGDRFILRDLGSRNGIQVDGKRVQEADVHPGTVIAIGKVRLRLAVGDSQPVSAAGPPVTGRKESAPTAAVPHQPVPAQPAASTGAEAVPKRKVDWLAWVLGAGIVVALAGVYLALRREQTPRLETVALKAGEERYFRFPSTIDSIGAPTPSGVVEVRKVERGGVFLLGLEAGAAELPVELVQERVRLQVNVSPVRSAAPVRAARADTAEEADRRVRDLMREADLAAREGDLLSARDRYEEASELGGRFPELPQWSEAADKRDHARREIAERRASHESNFMLAVGQNNRRKATEEALWMLFYLDPVRDRAEHQRWVRRLEDLGVPEREIPVRLRSLKGQR